VADEERSLPQLVFGAERYEGIARPPLTLGRNAGSALLGEHGAKIEIFYGDEETPFLGSINRRNTGPGQTPRISSATALKPRFQQLPEGHTMVVDVYSPLSIRIRPKTY